MNAFAKSQGLDDCRYPSHPFRRQTISVMSHLSLKDVCGSLSAAPGQDQNFALLRTGGSSIKNLKDDRMGRRISAAGLFQVRRTLQIESPAARFASNVW